MKEQKQSRFRDIQLSSAARALEAVDADKEQRREIVKEVFQLLLGTQRLHQSDSW